MKKIVRVELDGDFSSLARDCISRDLIEERPKA